MNPLEARVVVSSPKFTENAASGAADAFENCGYLSVSRRCVRESSGKEFYSDLLAVMSVVCGEGAFPAGEGRNGAVCMTKRLVLSLNNCLECKSVLLKAR